MKKSRQEYKKMRIVYQPNNIQVIFILESPPKSGKYFYDIRGRVTEPLFSAMMKVIKYKPKNKADGLLKFQKQGYLIVDASYVPVNGLRKNERDKKILNELSNLLNDLDDINFSRKIPLILVKANICRTLQSLLEKRGFRIANKGVVIPFPANGQQIKFHQMIKLVLKRAQKMKIKCSCDEPLCSKCLSTNCKDKDCPIHTKERKQAWQRRWEVVNKKAFPHPKNY